MSVWIINLGIFVVLQIIIVISWLIKLNFSKMILYPLLTYSTLTAIYSVIHFFGVDSLKIAPFIYSTIIMCISLSLMWLVYNELKIHMSYKYRRLTTMFLMTVISIVTVNMIVCGVIYN